MTDSPTNGKNLLQASGCSSNVRHDDASSDLLARIATRRDDGDARDNKKTLGTRGWIGANHSAKLLCFVMVLDLLTITVQVIIDSASGV